MFWGYHWHIGNILEQNEVILVEGEKSVMKLETNNIFNSIAIGTSHISKEQMKILLKLRVNIIMALDKDKDALKDKNFLNLAKYNKCYIMEDTDNLLEEKDAPIDKGVDVFRKIYEKRRLVQ